MRLGDLGHHLDIEQGHAAGAMAVGNDQRDDALTGGIAAEFCWVKEGVGDVRTGRCGAIGEVPEVFEWRAVLRVGAAGIKRYGGVGVGDGGSGGSDSDRWVGRWRSDD